MNTLLRDSSMAGDRENYEDDGDSPNDNDEYEDDDEFFIEESIIHIEEEISELKSLVLTMMSSAKAMSNRFEKNLKRAVGRGKIAKKRNLNRK